MEITNADEICKPARRRLPTRRRAETTAFERGGTQCRMTIGYWADGSVGEIFLNAAHANSTLDVLMSDAAIIASIALQFGVPLDTLKHALKRDGQGAAASPIGAALDLIR